jgi:hypothetical protein
VLTARITGFLEEVGIRVVTASLQPDDAFLPGIRLERGELHMDESQLAYPGDLLHEAGHIAAAPPAVRPALSGSLYLPDVDMGALEVAAIAWSYAAALAIGIDPAVVFHEGGYRGRSSGLLVTYGAGVYPGAHLLEEAGMTATGRRAEALGVAPYPHMLRWIRA